ncbi:heterokaryon incompatibility protein-domain-containing protein [Chaetomium strumarium]|uniref:Heterokaryon incompatibility protein-domain-containing protein n=1 Tax=Chaetomium strumarium TaxID=1170767 RepID=A0AAJ0M0X7_9PEZI|nr:heterokaryon incompatibility protein-domain-containing protein [Chaetomium strumarium]
MLCETCQNRISAAMNGRSYYHDKDGFKFAYTLYDTKDEVDRGVAVGCYICRAVWTSLAGPRGSNAASGERWLSRNLPLQFTVDVHDDPIPSPCMDPEDAAVSITLGPSFGRYQIPRFEYTRFPFHLIPTPKDVASLELNTTIEDTPISTAESAEVWANWFQACSKFHAECRKLAEKVPRFTPDRLIEILGGRHEKDLRWRLVLREDIGDVPYLTLSHCWGTSLPLRLTKNNYSEFLRTSSCSRLPKTFQDALDVTLSLGFRYIWIDSLCIIQGDADDWRTQSSMMWNIYKSSECNIAATWASDGRGGCFAERVIEKPTTIVLDSIGARPTTSIRYRVEYELRYQEDVMEAPLNSRCWVVQERYLAKKQLNFARSQVYWECPELLASEHFPTGIPKAITHSNDRFPNTKPTIDSKTGLDLRREWGRLVKHYSSCKLTYQSDKLIALSGLAAEVRNATNDVYLAGMWQEDLQRQLCWMPYSINRSRTAAYLAPTWSWVSLDGEVNFDSRYHRDCSLDHDIDFLEVMDISAHSEDPSGLHSFIKLELTVRGIALWTRAVDTPTTSDFYTETRVAFSTHTMDSEISKTEVSVLWDENVSSGDNPERWQKLQEERNATHLFLCVSLRGMEAVEGLVLREVHAQNPTDTRVYTRAGKFQLVDPIGHMSLVGILLERLGYKYDELEEDAGKAQGRNSELLGTRLDFTDPRIADLVHVVTII